MLVLVDILPIRMPDLAEAVHVELPDEGGEIPVFEVAGQNLLGKFADVFYVKWIAGRCPAQNGLQLTVLPKPTRTSTIYSSLDMKRGIWLPFPFLALLLFI